MKLPELIPKRAIKGLIPFGLVPVFGIFLKIASAYISNQSMMLFFSVAWLGYFFYAFFVAQKATTSSSQFILYVGIPWMLIWAVATFFYKLVVR